MSSVRGTDQLDSEDKVSNKVMENVLENSGLAREYVTYRYAFELMDEELRQDLLKLYPDVETESDYLKATYILYEILGEKGTASPESKDAIASLVVKQAYNEYAVAPTEKKERTDLSAWSFHGYFADIPLLEIARKWAEYNSIDLPDKEDDDVGLEKMLVEKLKAFAEQRKTNIGELIRQTTRKWLDEGLLDDYAPLFLSDGKETVNGEDAKLSHKEIFRKWLQIKTNAEQKIQEMIDKGKLETRMITNELLGVEHQRETILGKSLYKMKDGLRFVLDYKKQAEAFMPVGFLLELINEGGLIEKYAILLGFQDIFTRLSRIYEIDLTYKVEGYIVALQDKIAVLNDVLRIIKDKYGCEAYTLYDCRYFMDVPQTSFVIDLDGVQPEKKQLPMYYKDFEKTFGGEF